MRVLALNTMADALENLQEAQRRRRSDETESIEETNGRDSDSRVKIMNKNFDVGYYDKTESIQISQEKGNEDERESSIKSRPEKRAKTIPDSRESLEDLEKGVVNNKDIPESLKVDIQDSLHERIEKRRREAQDNQQINSEREAHHDQQNMEQQRDIERKGRDIRFRLDQFYNRQRKKKQQEQEIKSQQQQEQEIKSQQQQEFTQQQQQKSPPPPQQQKSLVSHFHLYHLVEKLTDATETGTRDQKSDALVTELSNNFNKSQQLLNSISGSLGVKSMTVDGQKQKLGGSEKLLQQRRELIMEYRRSVEDILKIEP